MSVDRLSRRRTLTGLSTVGLVSVVGCVGDTERLTIGVGPSGSRSYQAGHALAVAVERHSDDLSLRVESVGPPSQRLYAVDDGTVAGAGVDNTTLYRASEDRGVFDLDPIESLPYQGFAYGYREQYWLAVDGGTTPASTAEFGDRVVYPGQPSEPSRLVTEQLLRDAELWEAAEIDNRPREALPAAVDEQAVDCLVAAQHVGRERTDWAAAVDEQVGERLAVVPTGSAFQTAIDDAPNTVARDIEPVGWETAGLGESVAGWAVPLQWLWSPTVDADVIAELTRIAHDHSETLRGVDGLALDGNPDGLSQGVIDGLAVHEGAADVFSERDESNSDREGDATD